jgi:ankyrin repeat protein
MFIKFLQACQDGNDEFVKSTISQFDINTDIDNVGTPLYFACCYGKTSTVAILLAHGANTNQLTLLGNSSPLLVSAATGRTEIVELLLKHNANPNIVSNYGETPLHNAAEHGIADVTLKLLEYKANPDTVDNYLNTPLHCAAAHRDTSFFEFKRNHLATLNYLLLFSNRSILTKNKKGQTFLDITKEPGWSAPKDWEKKVNDLYTETLVIKKIFSYNISLPLLHSFQLEKNEEQHVENEKPLKEKSPDLTF